jgi:hypothetical protein
MIDGYNQLTIAVISISFILMHCQTAFWIFQRALSPFTSSRTLHQSDCRQTAALQMPQMLLIVDDMDFHAAGS